MTPAGPAAETLRQIPLAEIRETDRLRPVSDAHAAWIAGDFARLGQLQPIDVCHEGKGFRLVDGAHRLAAARLLGWTTINAIVRDHEGLARKAREISANLVRADLNPLDRATFVAELVAIEKAKRGIAADADDRALGGKAKAAKAQALAAPDTMSGADEAGLLAEAFGVQAEIAERVGLADRSVRRDLSLVRRLDAEALRRLQATTLATKLAELNRLAKLTPAKQLEAVDAFERGEAPTVDAAIRFAEGSRPKQKPSKADTLMKYWMQASAKERASFLRDLPVSTLPPGFGISKPGRA